jgi:hypothetical protein
MGKHESIKDEPSGAAATAPASAFESSATPIMALASNELPNLESAVETIKIETEKLAIAARVDEPGSGEVLGPRTAESPRWVLASYASTTVELPKSEFAATDMPKMESPRITPDLAPDLAPDLTEAESFRDDAAGAAEMPEPPEEPTEAAPPPRISRFTMLAAALALSAGVGGMVGALGAASFMNSAPATVAVHGKTGLEEIHALKENVVQARAEIAALKVAIDSGTRNASAQFTRIGERVERVERLQAEPVSRLNKAVETLERLHRAETTGKGGDVTGSVTPPQTVAAGGPNTRPGALEGWVVRDVQRGTALIEGRMGLVEVDQGDVVPGLGRIEAVRKQDGRWVVVTSKGTIMPPR